MSKVLLLGAFAGVIAFGAATTAGALVASGSPLGPTGQQTHPRVKPAVGGARTHFVVAFRLRDQPGHNGVLATSYNIRLTTPRCTPPQPAAVETGTAGAIARVRLIPPIHGWCVGIYKVTILLERGPFCPRPVPGQAPRACPLFATQQLDVGEAQFNVLRQPR